MTPAETRPIHLVRMSKVRPIAQTTSATRARIRKSIGGVKPGFSKKATEPAIPFSCNCPGTPAKRDLHAVLSRKNIFDARKVAHSPPYRGVPGHARGVP